MRNFFEIGRIPVVGRRETRTYLGHTITRTTNGWRVNRTRFRSPRYQECMDHVASLVFPYRYTGIPIREESATTREESATTREESATTREESATTREEEEHG